MAQLSEHYEFRERLVDAVSADLRGPSSSDEVLEDPPLTRYITGILYPQSGEKRLQALAPEDDIDLGEGADESTHEDPPVAMANAHYPASMGLTFAVDLATSRSVMVTPTAAVYSPVEEVSKDRELLAATWKRRDLDLPVVEVDVATPTPNRRIALSDGLELYVRVRESSTAAVITVALVNTRVPPSFIRDADAFFQVGMEIAARDGSDCFVERRTNAELPADADLRSYALIYRHARVFAAGHGCAADWDTSDDGTRARAVRTHHLPRHDLHLSQSNPAIRSAALELPFLTRGTKNEVRAALDELCTGYRDWILAREAETDSLPDHLQPTAREHIESCREALGRIESGVAYVCENSDAWDAFRLANRAMLIQRSRSEWIAAGRPTPQPDLDGDYEWRPFQLAFILQCVAGLAEPDHPDREIADLLWFPTGGGKTEAYLGLIAFTVFLRRLRAGSAGAGVTVLMRYTLRLLTIQQFDRAALLICCCESLRSSDPRLGDEPITLGLWIGRAGSPNKLTEARAALDKLRGGVKVEEMNPVQLHRCPWCGTALSAFEYIIAASPARLMIRCKNAECEFQQPGLPVFVVDEDIYRYRPTFIIATADKFATLPWSKDVGAMFNRNSGTRPPELIVQDELHLISGPLGTLAGLYETAIDFLCTDHGRPPKVIASTATIRRAGDQTKNLFTREMRQFPPPGLDSRDSYFAVEATSDELGTRRYLGLMAPGTSQTTLLVRTYAALLQGVLQIDAPDEVKDPYWTLVGYFNSLRVLGGARMQVQDDVRDRIRLLAGEGPARAIEERIELTSREASSDIPQHLVRMDVSYPDVDALDVILATNMISVGVDIDRLGLMAVMGQPQSTSEYIQSTSRVGRRFPGLVCVLFNSSRSRDRSHYESFVAFHSAIYRQVESTSVTPFSPRARDRGLHAVLIALARLTIGAFQENKGAADVDQFRSEVENLAERIVERVQRVDAAQAAATREQLTEIIEGWCARADANPNLVFTDRFHPDRALLVDAGRDEDDAPLGTFPTLSSLRDVDLESNLFLVAS